MYRHFVAKQIIRLRGTSQEVSRIFPAVKKAAINDGVACYDKNNNNKNLSNRDSDSMNHFIDSNRFMNLNQIYSTLVCSNLQSCWQFPIAYTIKTAY